MEGDNQNLDMSTSNGIPMNSRWNPTKKQISMLESFYKQGIRTPTAEQIQQITSRLKAYGQIEGKNVFYWFQNHKARQRQKQKQENLAYMNHNYFHKSQPLFHPPPCQNVACSPYYLSQSEVGYYSQCQKVLFPAGGLRRRPRAEKMEKMKTVSTAGYHSAQLGYGYDAMSMYPSGCLDESMINTRTNFNINCQETLPLFPLQPTGTLHGKTEASSPASSENFPTPASSEGTGMEERSNRQIFYDFFSGQGSCESD